MTEQNNKATTNNKSTSEKVIDFISDLLKPDTTTMLICVVILTYSVLWPLWPVGSDDLNKKNRIRCNNLEFFTCDSGNCTWRSGNIKNMEKCLNQRQFTIPTASEGKITCDDIFTYNNNQRLLKSTAFELFKSLNQNTEIQKQKLLNNIASLRGEALKLQNAMQDADGKPLFKEVPVPIWCKIAYPLTIRGITNQEEISLALILKTIFAVFIFAKVISISLHSLGVVVGFANVISCWKCFVLKLSINKTEKSVNKVEKEIEKHRKELENQKQFVKVNYNKDKKIELDKLKQKTSVGFVEFLLYAKSQNKLDGIYFTYRQIKIMNNILSWMRQYRLFSFDNDKVSPNIPTLNMLSITNTMFTFGKEINSKELKFFTQKLSDNEKKTLDLFFKEEYKQTTYQESWELSFDLFCKDVFSGLYKAYKLNFIRIFTDYNNTCFVTIDLEIMSFLDTVDEDREKIWEYNFLGLDEEDFNEQKQTITSQKNKESKL
jgi:hypothetical protein